MLYASSLQASPSDCRAKLDEIRELLKPLDSDSPETKDLKASLLYLPDQWQQLLDNGQISRLSQDGISMGLRSSGTQIPGLSDKINAFKKCIIDENLRLEEARINQAQTLLARVATTLEKSKKAEELDELMQALSENQIADYGNSPSMRKISTDLQNALEIVTDWQDYLIAEETNNISSRRNHLQQISQRLARSPILPRSVVLRLLNKHMPAQPVIVETTPKPKPNLYTEIQRRMKESGDSKAALAEIKAHPETPPNGSEDQIFAHNVNLIEELRLLEPSMTESEVMANMRNFQNNTSRNQTTYLRAIHQVLLNAIAKNHDIETPSSINTSPQKVLNSIAQKAADDRDWEKLRKAVISLETLARSTTQYAGMNKRAEDLKIISQIQLGETAEQRNDIEAAYSAYLEASLLDGEFLQRDVGYSKIANLRDKHPDKVADMMTKAAEIRHKTEVARHIAELEHQERMMNRPPINFKPEPLEMKELRTVVEQVVAEFLKTKRKEDSLPPEKNDPGEPAKTQD